MVLCRTSALETNWYRLIPSSLRRHHRSTVSIFCTSFSVTAQHSEPYRKIGKMHVLYNFNSVAVEMRGLQIWLSKQTPATKNKHLGAYLWDKVTYYSCKYEQFDHHRWVSSLLSWLLGHESAGEPCRRSAEVSSDHNRQVEARSTPAGNC